MSGRLRYTEEFKREAAAQVTDRGYAVKDVAERLGRIKYRLQKALESLAQLKRG